MSWTSADRVAETTITTGTGTVTLAGAKTGYQAFSAALSDGDVCYYVITDGTNWEVGLGTFTLSGTTLARTTVIASSNSNAKVSWSSGSKDVFLDAPASKLVQVDSSGKVGIGLTATQALDVAGTIRSTVGYNIGGAQILGTATSTSTNTYTTLADVAGTAVLYIGTATTSGGRAYSLNTPAGISPANYNVFYIGPDFNILTDAPAKANASAQHSQGAVFNGTAWVYIESGDRASSYGLNNGKIFFRVAGTATSTAGSAVTWQERLLIHNDGFIAVGGTGAPSFTPTQQLDVRGNINVRGGGVDAYMINGTAAINQAVIGTSTYTVVRSPTGLTSLFFGDAASGDANMYFESNGDFDFYTLGGGTQYASLNANFTLTSTAGVYKIGAITVLSRSGAATKVAAGASPSTSVLLNDGGTMELNFANNANFNDSTAGNLASIGTGGLQYSPTTGIQSGFILSPADAHGATWTEGYSEELFTPASGSTADTTTNMLPANSIVTGFAWRVTTAFSGSGTLSIGDATVAARIASGVALTLGTNGVSAATMNTANANTSGPVQASAAKIRLTRSTGTFNGTGTIRLVVFWRQLTAPTS